MESTQTTGVVLNYIKPPRMDVENNSLPFFFPFFPVLDGGSVASMSGRNSRASRKESWKDGADFSSLAVPCNRIIQRSRKFRPIYIRWHMSSDRGLRGTDGLERLLTPHSRLLHGLGGRQG